MVSIIHIKKGGYPQPCTLNGQKVERISAFLVPGEVDSAPRRLAANARSSFEGFMIDGQGFLFDDTDSTATPISEMNSILQEDQRNQLVIGPYLGGRELNTDPRHMAHRYAINFGTMSEDEAQRWPRLYKIVRQKVKPERDSNARESRRKRWWQYGETRPGLVAAVRGLDRVLVCSQTSSHVSFAFLPTGIIWSTKLEIFPFEDFSFFCIMQSRVHEFWARFFGSTMKDDPVYVPTDCYETFPFPQGWKSSPELNSVGSVYHEFRSDVMISRNEGLTKTYNRFHDAGETAPDIVRLRLLHHEMDVAVLRAYGWDDLAARSSADFLTEDNEPDHRYQGRLFWLNAFRDEVLGRLLDLNRIRASEERALGLGVPGPKGSDPDSESVLEEVLS